jgi:hypothetical protein
MMHKFLGEKEAQSIRPNSVSYKNLPKENNHTRSEKLPNPVTLFQALPANELK